VVIDRGGEVIAVHPNLTSELGENFTADDVEWLVTE